jgi:hypothetical protein
MAASWPLQRDCNKFYGNPRGKNGSASAAWESANLTLVKCPWVLRYDGKPVKGLRVHKKVAESLQRVLAAIWERVGRKQAEIDRIGMSIYGGGYNFRLMRGGSNLSMHSWGCALDFDPARNGMGDTTPNMDLRVVEEFEREGWEWGGHWKDGMHFQAAWTRPNPPRLKKKVAAPVGFMSAPEEDEPEATEAPHGQQDEKLAVLQRRLVARGYFEIGEIDGKWGSRTAAGIAGFKNDRGMVGAALPDKALDAELSKAESEGWSRPIAESRKEASDAKVAEVSDAIPAAKQNGVMAWILGLPATALAFFSSIASYFRELWENDAVVAVREFAADNIGIIAGAIAIFAVFQWYTANRAKNATTEAYQEGRLT